MNGGVDPGVTSALAIYSGPTPAVTTFVRPRAKDIRPVLEWCVRTAADRGEEFSLQIEDQFATIRYVMVRGKRTATIDLPSLVSLVRSAELWVHVAEDLGIEWSRVLPAVWQGPTFTDVPKTRAGKKLDAKQKATLAVASVWKTVMRFEGLPDPGNLTAVAVNRLTEHERDAALIGRHHILHGGSPC